jgi:hypothetical protein
LALGRYTRYAATDFASVPREVFFWQQVKANQGLKKMGQNVAACSGFRNGC